MQIKNDDIQFIKFLEGLKEAHFEQGDLLRSLSKLNKLDYHWFLISLLEIVNSGKYLEILDDRDGSIMTLVNIKVDINDKINNEITITGSLMDSGESVTLGYNIIEIDDARVPHGIHKYYVRTIETLYRFSIRTED
ncbi:MAG: hypothetical protein E7248_00670 [Paenibacillaceae bacterium]|nr:hypothetical protein [Paenibacillaceae bacterium]